MTLSPRNAALSAAATIALCAAIALFTSSSAPLAAGDDTQVIRTISVNGIGEVKGTPDEAHLTAGVLTEAKTAADALANNSRRMNQVFATLKRLGIPEKNIQTSNFNISPRYADADPGQPYVPQVIGYQVTNTVQVTVDGVDRVGPAIDALVSSGANQSQGIFFTIADPKPLEREARQKAVREAIEKARTIAEAAGLRLVRILTVNEGGGYAAPVPIFAQRMAAEAVPAPPPPPVAAGEATVMVNVSLVYEVQ